VHPDPVREIALRQAHRLKKFLNQHFSRMRWLSMRRYANHGTTSSFIQ
jgi:hypothetical protein